MAQAYPYQNSAQMLYWPAHGPRFFEAWGPSDYTKNDLLCAELSRLAYADRQTVTSALPAIKFTLRHWIGGETAEQRGATYGTDGFITTSDESALTVLAFRGTESNKPEDVLTDAMATSVPWNPQDASWGKVHQGFARVYALVREDIRRELDKHSGPLLITGHSLGAGLATLAAADYAGRVPAPELITFGSPRVGDKAFKAKLAGLTIQRFVDCCDLVTRIPPKGFDEGHIEKLLVDLIPKPQDLDVIAKSLIKAVAAGLAGALAAKHVEPEYEHVREAIYRNRDGKALASVTPEAIEADQRAARADYHGSFTPNLKHLMQQLVAAVFAAGVAGDPAAIRDAIRHFGARLFQGDPVPLRDLADHTPLNYVTFFTGRE